MFGVCCLMVVVRCVLLMPVSAVCCSPLFVARCVLLVDCNCRRCRRLLCAGCCLLRASLLLVACPLMRAVRC